MSRLEEILAQKRREVAERARERPLEELVARARDAEPPRGFRAALESSCGTGPAGPGSGLKVIAEVKRSSPSKGVIRADFDPVAIARAYEAAGAAAVSVLTDEPFFQGRLEHLEAVRRAVRLPVLRKDFVLDPYQVWEARAAGADAVLLILAAVPGDGDIGRLAAEVEGLGMDVLWEVHDLAELRRLVPREPRLVGINNRDLKTFEVSLETTRRLLPEVPRDAIVVSESGFSRRRELEEMARWGVGAFLIGESLLRAPDPGEALRDLLDPRGGCEP